MSSTRIDPITLSTIWHTFQRVCYEMREVLERTAQSYLIGRLHDNFPGGYFPNGYDIHSEGICISPIKVIEQGRERSDVMGLLLNNVRFRDAVRVDNASMIASTKRARVQGLGSIFVAPERRSPEYLRKLVGSEIEKWRAAVKAGGVPVDQE